MTSTYYLVDPKTGNSYEGPPIYQPSSPVAASKTRGWKPVPHTCLNGALKYAAPMIQVCAAITMFVCSTLAVSPDERLFCLSVGNLFIGVSVGTLYYVLRKRKHENAGKIALYAALALIFGELAANPILKLFANQNASLEFFFVSNATTLAAKGLIAIRKKDDTICIRAIVAIAAYALCIEYPLIHGVTPQNGLFAATTVVGLACIGGAYIYLNDTMKHKRAKEIATLLVLSLLMLETAFTSNPSPGVQLSLTATATASLGLAAFCFTKNEKVLWIALALIFGQIAFVGNQSLNFDRDNTIFFSAVAGGCGLLALITPRIKSHRHP